MGDGKKTWREGNFLWGGGRERMRKRERVFFFFLSAGCFFCFLPFSCHQSKNQNHLYFSFTFRGRIYKDKREKSKKKKPVSSSLRRKRFSFFQSARRRLSSFFLPQCPLSLSLSLSFSLFLSSTPRDADEREPSELHLIRRPRLSCRRRRPASQRLWP